MILYLDTSALVKLYVREPGTEAVKTLAAQAPVLATSMVAYAETRAAFVRLVREGATTGRRHEQRLGRFNADWDAYARVELTPALARGSGELAEAYALRGFDAIHLASALWLNDTANGALAFAAYDTRLCAAASRAGLKVVTAVA